MTKLMRLGCCLSLDEVLIMHAPLPAFTTVLNSVIEIQLHVLSVGPGISGTGEPTGHWRSRTDTMARGRRGRENRASIHSTSTSVGQSFAEE